MNHICLRQLLLVDLLNLVSFMELKLELELFDQEITICEYNQKRVKSRICQKPKILVG